VGERGRAWPVPFSVAPVLAHRGRTQVAVLASGDPFHHGAGASLARHLAVGEWRNYPQPSTFALVAGELGWSQEATCCLGLHARPFEALAPLLHEGGRFICLLRDGPATQALAAWLAGMGWGESALWLFSNAGGGDAQVLRTGMAAELARRLAHEPVAAPVAAAFEARSAGGSTTGLPQVPGRALDAFVHDGQITKPPVRAITLAALAPRRGEWLWDLGSGSGSVAVEWCLAGGQAVCVEQHAARVANIAANARRYAAPMTVHHGRVLDWLDRLAPEPHAVFVGGGFDAALFDALCRRLEGRRWRLVVNAVTLDTQQLLMQLHATHGGQLLHLQWSEAQPLGGMQAWSPARATVQWAWSADGNRARDGE
jgi:precorrin-6Y C5,15-methyltransferase (decarboxylating)